MVDRQRRHIPLTNQVREWLRTHPGPHRPSAVAAALGEKPGTVAMTLRYLAQRNEAEQTYVTHGRRDYAVYAHTGESDASTQ